MNNIQIPPGKYFMSHSYWDRVILDGYTRPEKSSVIIAPDGTTVNLTDAIDHTKDPISLLQKQLPDDVTLYVFPPITVSPLEFVSNPLIEALLECDGVIVLDGGFSERSFWVAFERDYALRSGKRVYSYSQQHKTLNELIFDQNSPFHLPIGWHVVALAEWNDTAKGIISFMVNERFFAANLKWKAVAEAGGYVVLFVAPVNEKFSQHNFFEQTLPQIYERMVDPQRIIIALLESTAIPEGYDTTRIIRLHPKNADDSEPEHLVDNNSVDDLIVQLYWMIYKNQSLNFYDD